MKTVVLLWKLMKINNKASRDKFINKYKSNDEFIHLLWLSANSGLAFRTTLDIPPPERPQPVVDNVKEFISIVDKLINNPFDTSIIEEVEDFVCASDDLSAYIYSEVLNKCLPITQDEFNTIIPNGIPKEPYEIPSTYGAPLFPCICQLVPANGLEAVVTVDNKRAFIKDKGGCPIGGFDTYLDDFKQLKLDGTFNVVIYGNNIGIFKQNAKGANKQPDVNKKMLIVDYQCALPLSNRLALVEAAMFNLTYPRYIEIAASLKFDDISSVARYVKLIGPSYPYKLKVLARQDTIPKLWEIGEHNIDITKLLKIV